MYSFLRSHKVIIAVIFVFLASLTFGAYYTSTHINKNYDINTKQESKLSADSTTKPDTNSSTSNNKLLSAMYGITLDRESGIRDSLLNKEVKAIKALPYKPTIRIVFDKGMTHREYDKSVNSLYKVGSLIGQIADSSDLAKYSQKEYHNTTSKWLKAYKNKINIWEIGNEVNGNWTGSYDSVIAKIHDSFIQVKNTHRQTMLTLWYNPNCAGDSNELDPVTFSKQYIPSDMKSGLDYVMISYYETECNGQRPTTETFTNLFETLHSIYPNAKLGFGEISLTKPVTPATLPQATSIANYYYGLQINLPYYIGGYFWWQFSEDAVPESKQMWQVISNGFTKMDKAINSPTTERN